jgi:hypothetical protein
MAHRPPNNASLLPRLPHCRCFCCLTWLDVTLGKNPVPWVVAGGHDANARRVRVQAHHDGPALLDKSHARKVALADWRGNARRSLGRGLRRT